ncbi:MULTISPECIES: class I SAM-dependent methyltransferase [unclassified Microbacterium]|uniref:class I SAM-dependent methyltransferase n=1 Tax=unclassified Microbacterium TaxID=2609290 RepID=UPI000EAA3225|nr:MULTISPECIES: class I SAM-dependent methyltransferase [unclassified Microbacterium]MBT2486856.1 class I SAM-dependent methyltransferase [Microbacterium sp. ISL-108]RKN64775.1 class I SAM-dependent methyltransferase [Microbacterium sp. CGR2]
MSPAPGESDAAIAGAYDARAAEYVQLLGSVDQMDERDRETIRRWRDETPGLLLDAGCGPGHWTGFLSGDHREVVGVDISGEFVRSARRTHPELRFEQVSFRELPFEDASVGGILAWYSLIHTRPADVPAVLTEFARVLTPEGALLLGFFEGRPREPFDHQVTTAYYWSADALAELLADAGFEVTSREERRRRAGEPSARPHGALVARRN